MGLHGKDGRCCCSAIRMSKLLKNISFYSINLPTKHDLLCAVSCTYTDNTLTAANNRYALCTPCAWFANNVSYAVRRKGGGVMHYQHQNILKFNKYTVILYRRSVNTDKHDHECRVESGCIGLEIFGPPHQTKKIFGRSAGVWLKFG